MVKAFMKEREEGGTDQRRFPKRKRKSVSSVAYSDKTLNVHDMASRAITVFTQPSTIVDVERNVFMTDVSGSSTVEKGASLMDPANLAQIRPTIGGLLRKGACERVFADPRDSDGQNFFKAVLVNELVTDDEVRVCSYELYLKRVEAALRRVIVATLQVQPKSVTRMTLGYGPDPEAVRSVEDDEWLTVDCHYLGRKVLDHEDRVCTVVAWCREVEVEKDDVLEVASAASSDEGVTKGTLKGRVVARHALYKIKVDNTLVVTTDASGSEQLPPESKVINEFQLRTLAEAYRLKETLRPTVEEIQGNSTVYTSYKSKVGKRLQFCEYNAVPLPDGKGATLDTSKPRWHRGVCVGVDPAAAKIMILPDDGDEGFWVDFDPKTALCVKEGETAPTKIKFAGDGAEYDMADNFLKWLVGQSDSWLFLEPVDPVALNIPTYFDVIKKPMDISTMRTKLDSGAYNKENDQCDLMGKFHKDLELMFKNAILFNGEKSEVASITNRLRKKCDKKLQDALRKLRSGGRADFGTGPLKPIPTNFGISIGDVPLEDFEPPPAPGDSRSSSRSWAIEEGMKLNKLIAKLPIVTDTSEFSLSKDWVLQRSDKKKQPESGDASNAAPGAAATSGLTKSEADIHAAAQARARANANQDTDVVKALGLRFCRRDDPSCKVEDREALEVWNEENHVEMGWLYQKMLAMKEPKRKKEKVKGWVSADGSGVKGAIKMRKGKTGLMVNVRAEDFDKVKKQLELQAIEEKRRKEEDAEEALFAKNFHNSFPPWLGSIGEGAEGGLVWQIRKPFIVPAVRHVLRGLIQSGHVFEIESILPTKNSAGGGLVAVANYYLPSIPFTVLPRKPPTFKAKKQKKGDSIGYVKGTDESDEAKEEQGEAEAVVEMSDYEKARAERVARNNAYLKSLGLA